VKELALR
jgi:hypothetical protein